MKALPHRSALSPEKRFGGIAVSGGLVPVGFDAGDLGPEQVDALLQLLLRIGAEVLAREPARGIAPGARAVIVFHAFHNPPQPGCCQHERRLMHRRFRQ